jgi:multisubunit Na+/H+ antiporter MnhF subunit
MFSKRWWIRVAERMVKTVAQTFALLVGTDQAGWAKIDAVFLLRSMAIMALLSFASSIITSKFTDDTADPSAVK